MVKQQAGEKPPFNANRMAKDVMEFPQLDRDASPGHAAWTDWPWEAAPDQGQPVRALQPRSGPTGSDEPDRSPGARRSRERDEGGAAGLDAIRRRQHHGKDYPERQRKK